MSLYVHAQRHRGDRRAGLDAHAGPAWSHHLRLGHGVRIPSPRSHLSPMVLDGVLNAARVCDGGGVLPRLHASPSQRT
jgi:hypothetical protein